MTSNLLLLLNSSKTEFVLIGLKRQLAEIHSPSISIDTSQSVLASYLMNISHSPIRSLHCLNPATITSTFFAVSVLYLNFHTAKTIATSIGHSKLDYTLTLHVQSGKIRCQCLLRQTVCLIRWNTHSTYRVRCGRARMRTSSGGSSVPCGTISSSLRTKPRAGALLR